MRTPTVVGVLDNTCVLSLKLLCIDLTGTVVPRLDTVKTLRVTTHNKHFPFLLPRLGYGTIEIILLLLLLLLLYCIVFIHFYSASHSLSLSEALPTTAIDTVSEFTR